MKAFSVFIAAAVLSLTQHARADARSCIEHAESGHRDRDRGALLSARGHYEACIARDCPALVRDECTGWLRTVEASLPGVFAVATGPGGVWLPEVIAQVDGRPLELGRATALDPGTHHLDFRHPSGPHVEHWVTLLPREGTRRVVATFDPEPSHPPAQQSLPWLTWGTGGASVAAFGVFTALVLDASHEADYLRGTCSPGCTRDETSGLRERYLGADIALGIGIVSLGAAIYFAVKGAGGAPVPSRAQSLPRTMWK